VLTSGDGMRAVDTNRIVFRFERSDAREVKIVDCH
jgi:hypothetical protein